MNYAERPVLFECAGEELLGVAAEPERPETVGVVIVVGGPQYRAGSHRQFVLLARHLATCGFPTFRFDYRGIGDSTGAMRSFETVHDDIASAIDAFLSAVPRVRSVVLWGLCDGASAAMMYAPGDDRVCGLVLANPWARGEETEARARLAHYYSRRLLSLAFWRRLIGGEVKVRESAGSLAGTVAAAVTKRVETADYRVRMRDGLKAFRGAVLLVLSGQDLTAQEFLVLTRSGREWLDQLERPGVQRLDLPEADHTFSTASARLRLEESSIEFLLQRSNAVSQRGSAISERSR